jgi:hypothetical protein
MFAFVQRSGARAPLHGYDLTTFKYFPPWLFSLYIYGDWTRTSPGGALVLFYFPFALLGRAGQLAHACAARL